MFDRLQAREAAGRRERRPGAEPGEQQDHDRSQDCGGGNRPRAAAAALPLDPLSPAAVVQGDERIDLSPAAGHTGFYSPPPRSLPRGRPPRTHRRSCAARRVPGPLLASPGVNAQSATTPGSQLGGRPARGKLVALARPRLRDRGHQLHRRDAISSVTTRSRTPRRRSSATRPPSARSWSTRSSSASSSDRARAARPARLAAPARGWLRALGLALVTLLVGADS